MEEIAKSLDAFINSVTQFEDWYQQVWEILDSSDQEEADQLSARIEDISRQKDQRREDFDNYSRVAGLWSSRKTLPTLLPFEKK